MSKTLKEELKEVCVKIVGHWYCNQLKQHLIFDFNVELLKMAKLTVITSKETFETEYGVAYKINPQSKDYKTHFYFDVGKFNKRYYEIVSITKDMLVLSEFFMELGRNPITPHIYVRSTNLDAAEEILKGIYSN